MKPGLHVDVPFSQYAEDPAVNISSLLRFRHSPLDYWHWDHYGPSPDTDTFRVGRAVHTLVLEPHRFAMDYALFEGKVRRGKEWEEFKLAHEFQTHLTRKQWEEASAIAIAVKADPLARKFFGDGHFEVTCCWDDEDTGIRFKARLDWLASDVIVDLKTAKDIRPGPFQAAAARLEYHTRGAFYREGVLNVLGGTPRAFVLVVVRNTPPHDVAVYRYSEEALEVGKGEWMGLADQLWKCRESGEWPGIARGQEMELDLPAWAKELHEESLEIDGETW